jgi:DNA-binding transcriptional ArsR family regulator
MAIQHLRSDSLDDVFFALSNPTRRAIVARLARGEASVYELNEPFGLSQPTISKHLKVLENAGLIEGSRDAQRRPRRLRASAMKEVADWVEPFRQLWERRLDNLDRHLAKKTKREER